ncbi:MAG: cytochrome c oxidase subunit II, partial [Phycisphaerales bacterium]|nr:cytochrome c oxidase subunit II [Phycisphaerales bacterium]
MGDSREDSREPGDSVPADSDGGAQASFWAITLVILTAIGASVFAMFIPTDDYVAPGRTYVCPAPEGWNTNIFDPAPGREATAETAEFQTPAERIRDLAWLILGITAGIFVVVEGFLLLTIIKCRRKRDDTSGDPVQMYGSNPIELAWTIVPVMIVAVLALVTIRTIEEIELTEKPEGALEVHVIGHQWWWEFRYPDQGVVTANEMIVPRNTPIWMRLESGDVIHSFWVPRLCGKTDLIPNRVNHLWFETSEPDWYYGQCAEYCGNQHANMLLAVEVRTEEGFDDWVREQVKPPVRSDDPEVLRGREVFLEFACQSCHSIAG